MIVFVVMSNDSFFPCLISIEEVVQSECVQKEQQGLTHMLLEMCVSGAD